MVTEEFYESANQLALKMLEDGSSKEDILSYLTTAAETGSGIDAVASILLLDDEGLLRNGSSPKLPADYLKAIDGLRPHPNVGTCASAAATGSIVLTPDFHADDKWAELKHLPLALGFVGAWSMPIKTADGKVLGTFGTYFRNKRKPTPVEMKGIELLASAAGKVLSGL
jgi:GAF domain-containing protein